MTDKFTKLNHRFGLMEFPLTFAELKDAVKEFPKSERSFYELSFKAIKHHISDKENIYYITSGDPKLLKSGGFIIVADKHLILTHLKNGLRAKAESEVILYDAINSVDYDLAAINVSWVGAASLILDIKGFLGSKKRTITNIPQEDIDQLVNTIKLKMGIIVNTDLHVPPENEQTNILNTGVSVADELRKLADLKKEGLLTEEEFQTEKAKLLNS